jgi:Ca2+-binding EF-hand superfamily protein
MAEDAPPTQEELQQVFNAFDSDGTGTMSVEGMMDVMINQYVPPPITPLQPPGLFL